MACQALVIKTCERNYMDSWSCMLGIKQHVMHKLAQNWIDPEADPPQGTAVGLCDKSSSAVLRKSSERQQQVGDPKSCMAAPRPTTGAISPSDAHLSKAMGAESQRQTRTHIKDSE